MKKVSFAVNPEVKKMFIWTFAHKNSRKKYWEYLAIDRERFRRRIMETEVVIAPILAKEFRNKMYYSRFKV